MNSPSAIITYTGLFFDPINPDPSLIRIEDIAHALARQTRFSGHVKGWWSVANHSMLVAYFVSLARTGDNHDATWAQVHDGTEAYMVDIPSPLKQHESFAAVRGIENYLHEAIAWHYGLDWPMPGIVHEWDSAALWAEADIFMHGYKDWNYQPITDTQRRQISMAKDAIRSGVGRSRLNRALSPLGLFSPGSDEKMFLREFRRLTRSSIRRAA